VLLKALESLLDTSTVGVTGRSLHELLSGQSPPPAWQQTIRTLDRPLGPTGALVTLRGSLAPDGAVLKRAAASEALLHHRGPAVVFESPEDAAGRIDDPSLQITPRHVLVLRNAGPVAAGMPEAGSLPIPRYLAEQGVRDMVRVSDARMSGTAYGTVVLHCSPEAAAGGPLGLVRDGDPIEIDVSNRCIDLLVEEAEMARRRQHFTPPPLPERGWRRLYSQHVLPAHLGADLDFLAP
jgi:dihydroxy-acid dehydratase